MLYRFLKFALGYAVRSFFREIQLRNEERVPLKGPVIFLPNHRSAFMDPIVVAAYIKRRVHFLARCESFKKPWVAKILARLNMIPIYRKDFSPDDMHKNEEIFVHCHTLLEQGGALIIFPEGKYWLNSLNFNNWLFFNNSNASASLPHFLNHPILKFLSKNNLKLLGKNWKKGNKKCGSNGK